MITRAHIRRQLRKNGGIMSAVPRQGYFLGGIGKAIGSAVGKVGDVVGEITKSPIGKAALLGLGAYATRNMGPVGEAGGWKKWMLSKIPETTLGKAAAAGALATGSMLMLPSKEQKKLDLLKERGGNVEAYLRQYYKDYYTANWQEGWNQDEEDEFVAANTTEYSKGGRVGYGKGGDVMKGIEMGLSPLQSLDAWKAWKNLKNEGYEMSFSDYLYGEMFSKGGRVGLYGGGDPEMMDETLSPLQIMQDQGVPYSLPVDAGAKSITKEGVQMAGGPYNQGSDVKNALAVWNNMGPRDQADFEGFLDFFRSGIWRDQIQGLRIQEENMKMASDPDPDDALNDFSLQEFNKPLHQLTPEERDLLLDLAREKAAKGGRIKYGIGDLVKGRSKMVLKDFFNDEEEAYAQGGRIGYDDGAFGSYKDYLEQLPNNDKLLELYAAGDIAAVIKELKRRGYDTDDHYAKGGRIGKYLGGMGLPGIPRMAPDGLEYDMSQHGGFQPLGAQEGKDDVKANLAKNEFVMTADAVRGAGDGDIELGAQKMYDTMKRLENKVA